MDLREVTLSGPGVRLEPLALERHWDAMTRAANDPDLWRLTTGITPDRDGVRAYIETALAWHAAGTALPFATMDAATGELIGSTRYMNIDHPNRKVEIGSTWITRPFQRTAVNTVAKYVMLRYAFETLDCLRVELKTDVLNERSRAAILRIGATQEGIFRNHMVLPTGRIRDTVWFSIIDREWPAVKARLEAKIAS